MDDYATLDLRLNWKKKGVEIWLAGRNLSGEEYSSFAASDGVTVLNLNPSPEQVFEAGIRFEI
jgi:hypothetical protein